MLCEISPSVCLVSVLQYVALLALIIAFYAYRVTHAKRNQLIFRIERVDFIEGQTIFYCCRRWPFNQWRSFEVEEGVKGYQTQEQAEQAMKEYLKRIGLEGNETTVVREYGH